MPSGPAGTRPPRHGALEAVAAAATGGENVMGPIGDAVAADATVGEIGTVLRDSLGRWHFPLW